jgi:hypothetical protein
MLCDKNELLESRNFVDGVDFTCHDPCLFVVYPPGASGDLLISIIDKHYLRTGCEYYGISDTGRVHLYTADYEFMDIYRSYQFDSQWFNDVATSLGNRNLNYSLLDQIIFGCHMWQNNQVQHILDTFPKAKIIRILPVDQTGESFIKFFASIKVKPPVTGLPLISSVYKTNECQIKNERLIDLPFGFMFNKQSYYKHYDIIIRFLNLNGRLICFDYVKYYLSKQHKSIRQPLIDYSKSLLSQVKAI